MPLTLTEYLVTMTSGARLLLLTLPCVGMELSTVTVDHSNMIIVHLQVEGPSSQLSFYPRIFHVPRGIGCLFHLFYHTAEWLGPALGISPAQYLSSLVVQGCPTIAASYVCDCLGAQSQAPPYTPLTPSSQVPSKCPPSSAMHPTGSEAAMWFLYSLLPHH